MKGMGAHREPQLIYITDAKMTAKKGQLSQVSTLKQGKDQKSFIRILMSEKEGLLEINEFKLDFSR